MKPISHSLQGFSSFSKTEQLQHLFKVAISDGIYSDIEISQVEKFFNENNITNEDYISVRNKEFVEFLRKYSNKLTLTEREYASIYHIALQMNLNDDELNEVIFFLDSHKLIQ